MFLSVLALRGQNSVLMTLSQPLALSDLSTGDPYNSSLLLDFVFVFGIFNQIRATFAYFKDTWPLTFSIKYWSDPLNFQNRDSRPFIIFHFSSTDPYISYPYISKCVHSIPLMVMVTFLSPIRSRNQKQFAARRRWEQLMSTILNCSHCEILHPTNLLVL